LFQTEYRIDLKTFIEVIIMLFAERIRRLRDEMQMLQWQFAATKDIDAPLFSKIERGECHAIPKQVIAIAKIFKVKTVKKLASEYPHNDWIKDDIEKREESLLNRFVTFAQKYHIIS
jgi:ribosome-binding protein aMBF1 (putative translation factor)